MLCLVQSFEGGRRIWYNHVRTASMRLFEMAGAARSTQ